MPSRCYTHDQDFFHPDALLVEQLQDGDRLTVEVAPRVFVDEAGSPPMLTNDARNGFDNRRKPDRRDGPRRDDRRPRDDRRRDDRSR